MNGNKEVLKILLFTERQGVKSKSFNIRAICFFLVYMSRYSEHFVEILGFENRINTHFFTCEMPSNLGGAYSYTIHLKNSLLNVHIMESVFLTKISEKYIVKVYS